MTRAIDDLAMPFTPGTAQVHAGTVHAPYDLRQLQLRLPTQSLLTALPTCFQLDHPAAPPDYASITNLHVVGGFSQGMGDAVMGVGLLDYLQQRYGLRIQVFLAQQMPGFVYEVYELALARGMINAIQRLPCALDVVQGNPTTTAVVDLSDLFGHVFRDGPVIDLYARALGLDPALVPENFKRPGWLKPSLTAPAAEPYCLCVSQSKEAFKSIPAAVLPDAIHVFNQAQNTPVYGFDAGITSRIYRNVQAQSADATALIQLIANAQHVYTVDTAALHIAAGCGVATTALVVTPFWQSWCCYYLGQPGFTALHIADTSVAGWQAALASLTQP